MFDSKFSFKFSDQLLSVFQVSGLKYGTKYNYRVFAENAAGISKPTNIIGPLLADDPHGEGRVGCLWLLSAPTHPCSFFISQHVFPPAFLSWPDL